MTSTTLQQHYEKSKRQSTRMSLLLLLVASAATGAGAWSTSGAVAMTRRTAMPRIPSVSFLPFSSLSSPPLSLPIALFAKNNNNNNKATSSSSTSRATLLTPSAASANRSSNSKRNALSSSSSSSGSSSGSSSSSSSSSYSSTVVLSAKNDTDAMQSFIQQAEAMDDTYLSTYDSYDASNEYLQSLESSMQKTTRIVDTYRTKQPTISSTTSTAVDVDNAAAATAVVQEQSTKEGFFGLSEVAFARLLLVVAAALYGTNFSVVKILGNMDIPIGISATMRFGLAAAATSPWLLNTNTKHEKDYSVMPRTAGKLQDYLQSKDMWSVELGATLAGMEVGLWNSMAYVAQAVGLSTTLASKSAFLCSLAVVFVPLLDRLTGKQLQKKQLLGIVMAMAGVACLELGGLFGTDLLTFNEGDIASLVQPLAFGMAFWRMESAMHAYPDQAKRSTAAQLLAVFLSSAAFTLATDPGSFNMESIQHWLSNPEIVKALVWTGMVSTALTIYMESVALKTITAAETTLILSTEPLWGSAFAALLMGETFGWDAAVGGVLILSGCVYSSLGWDGIKDFLFKKKKSSQKTTISGQQPSINNKLE